MYKCCPACGELKSYSEFYKNRSQYDGHCGYCKECEKLRTKKHYEKFKDKYLRLTKAWAQKNPDKRRKYELVYYLKKANDPQYKINRALRTAMNRILKKKGSSVFELRPYSKEELVMHLEKNFCSGTSWDNYGEWHVDHITPISTYSYDSYEDPQFLQCWGLSNLQPLWASANLSKGSRND